MPIDARIVWDEIPRGKGTKIVGRLECTFCNQVFSREAYAETENAKWKIKEDISNEIGQHSHGK